MNNSLPKVSIVILDFLKSKRVIENVLSLKEQKVNFPVQIIVVDNSCNTENAKKLQELAALPDTELHFNENNLGYPKGVNRGAEFARGEYLLIVNPDIVWRDSLALQKLVDFMDAHREVGIAGPKQVNDSDGQIAMTVRAFPKLYLQITRRTPLRHLPFLRTKVHYDEMRHLTYEKTQSVDWLQSSCIIVRRELWERLNGLSEDYFLFMSDPDLCFRAWEEGYEVVYYPEAVVAADGLRCSEGGLLDFFGSFTMQQHLRDAIKYRLKYFGRKNPREQYSKKKAGS